MRATATTPPRAPGQAPLFTDADLQVRLARSLGEVPRGMRGSEILRIAGEVRRLIAQGRPICNLTVGDFDPAQFPIPEILREGIRDALAGGETNYPPSNGLPGLREAVAERVARDTGTRYPVESVLIASGVRPLLYAAFRVVLDPGETVVYGVPSWNTNHYAWLTQTRGIPVATERRHGFHPTADQLRPHLGEARLLCLCSPANPTGTMIAADELRRIAEAVVEENAARDAAGRPDLFLLFDQVYGALVHGGTAHRNPVELVPEVAPWTITLDGISKAFAATGLRVGWSLAAPAVTAKMSDFLGHVGAWAPRPEQVATAGFLLDDAAVTAFRGAMEEGIRRRLTALCEGFTRLREDGYPVDVVHPEGAIYVSLQVDLAGRSVGGRRLASNDDIRRLLLEEAGLALVPFQAFGVPEDTGWFRLSVGAVAPGEIAAMFPRIRALLDRLD